MVYECIGVEDKQQYAIKEIPTFKLDPEAKNLIAYSSTYSAMRAASCRQSRILYSLSSGKASRAKHTSTSSPSLSRERICMSSSRIMTTWTSTMLPRSVNR